MSFGLDILISASARNKFELESSRAHSFESAKAAATISAAAAAAVGSQNQLIRLARALLRQPRGRQLRGRPKQTACFMIYVNYSRIKTRARASVVYLPA